MSVWKHEGHRYDVLASVEEDYVEEIDLSTFIQAMLVESALAPWVIIPPGPTPETIPVIEAVSTLEEQPSLIKEMGFMFLPLGGCQ